jgi:hypothetical protein
MSVSAEQSHELADIPLPASQPRSSTLADLPWARTSTLEATASKRGIPIAGSAIQRSRPTANVPRRSWSPAPRSG